MHSNKHDLEIVFSSTDQVRFHPSFEKLDQSASFAQAEESFASAVNLFDFLRQFDIDDMQKLALQTNKSENNLLVLGRLQTCASQSGQSLKFNIWRSCAHNCEDQEEEEEEVSEKTLDELMETDWHRDEERFTAIDMEIEAENGKDRTVTREGAKCNNDFGERSNRNWNWQSKRYITLQVAQDDITFVDQVDLKNDDFTTGENCILYKDWF